MRNGALKLFSLLAAVLLFLFVNSESNTSVIDLVVPVEVKKPLDKVIPVRLPADKWEQMREEARELGVGPTTLARMWILEHLRQRVKA